jgi:hypothetical protein
MLKRHLENAAASPEAIREMAFPNLIRTGSEQGLLLSGWDVWTKFRDARNITGHTYGEENAAQVYAIIPRFREDVAVLLTRLAERNNGQ